MQFHDQPLDAAALAQLFNEARSYNGWLDKPVGDEQLHAVYDLMKMAPTSANMQPVRIVWVKSQEAKEKLAALASEGNRAKITSAPVTAIIGYDIDFQREVHPGDHFGMLYESFQDERGADVKTGVVLMAEFDGAALSKTFYRYTPSDDGRVDYFDATGQSAKKFLMKTPINGARLSSGYGMRRHPILGYKRMHAGLDFKAGYGAPIFAATNGVVAYAGRKGGYGNFVQINHGGGIATGYAHMSRIAASPGQRVRQGQIIGYVGSTGLSTGPHLHYEVFRNGAPVNPAGFTFTTTSQLAGADLARFRAKLANLLAIRPGTAARPAETRTADNGDGKPKG